MNEKPAARSLMQGSIWLMAGKAWFVISAFLLYSGLSRLLSPEEFGTYSLVVNLVSIFNMVLITTTIQSISKFTALGIVDAVKHQGLKILFFLGGGLALACFFSAPAVAAWFKDPEMIFPLHYAAFIMFFYGLYAVFIGSINGQKRFSLQAFFDGGYSTLRLAMILSLAHLTGTVHGAVWGFLLASMLIVGIAFFVIGPGKKGESFRAKEFLNFSLFLIGFHLIANLMTSADLFLLKRLSGNAQEAGFYAADLTLAKIPYMILAAVNLAVFPMVSAGQGEKSEIQTLAQRGFMLCLVFALLPAALFAADPAGTLRLIYPPAYLAGADALIWLSIAYALFCIFMFSSTVLNAAVNPAISLAVAAAGLLIQVFTASQWIPAEGMKGAALAACAGYGAAFTLQWIILAAKKISPVPIRQAFSALAIAAIIFLISSRFPAMKLKLLAKDILLAGVYLAAIFGLKIIRIDELLSAAKRKQNAAA